MSNLALNYGQVLIFGHFVGIGVMTPRRHRGQAPDRGDEDVIVQYIKGMPEYITPLATESTISRQATLMAVSSPLMPC